MAVRQIIDVYLGRSPFKSQPVRWEFFLKCLSEKLRYLQSTGFRFTVRLRVIAAIASTADPKSKGLL